MISLFPRQPRFRFARTLDAFDDLWPRFNETGASFHHVFQTREHIETWLATIGAARRAKPLFVRVDDADGAPLMFLPLCFERRRGALVLTFQDGGVVDYNAPILFAGGAALERRAFMALWRKLLNRLPPLDAIVFEKVPDDVCGAANPLRFLAEQDGAPSGHCLVLDGTWAHYVENVLHRPKDSRRKRRRLADAGDVRFVVAETPEQRERMLHEMMRQKTQRFFIKAGMDAFDRPGYRAYFPAMTERFHASGQVHLSMLEVDGESLATHWGMINGARFYSQMLTYKVCALAQYSPARLLCEDLIAWSYARGLTAYDLGAGDARWKDLLGARAAPLRHIAIPRSALGWAYLQAKQWARRKDEAHAPRLSQGGDVMVDA